MMVAGYGSFRWVSNTQSHNEQPSAKPSAILRFVGLLFIIVGSLLLLRGMFGVLSSAFLVMQGGLDQEGIIILLKVLVIGPVPGLLLVFAGRKLRMASLGHLAGASPN
jgi:nicotinamide riboside transporter PnuC